MFWNSNHGGLKRRPTSQNNISLIAFETTMKANIWQYPKSESYESATASNVVVIASREINIYPVQKSSRWQDII
jgi:hypothetical protein